jgi:ribosomal protein S18 acetylase RimI-like enzyme
LSAPDIDPPIIRDARPDDRETVADFNAWLAEESEGKHLDRAVLLRGVDIALADPDRLRYWVAEAVANGEIVGQAAVTREWSDWRNGWIWWLQSVYVRPECRRRGVFAALFQHIREEAVASREVIGIRLYVEAENHRAQATYQALGLRPGGYDVFEEFWLERFELDRPQEP